MNVQFAPIIHQLFQIFKQNGYRLYLVGGCVRDFLMHRCFTDYDMCTNATPDEMITLAKKHDIKIIPTGIKHGTLTFILEHVPIEITTFRTESEYEKNRFPKAVQFSDDLQEDIKRRDFTMNAICMDETTIYDFFDGQGDIENKLIRCVGDANSRFQEDALRMLRCLRFSFTLNFAIEMNTWKAIQDNAPLLNNISKERIRDELCKMLMSDHQDILLILKEAKVLDIILPEFIATYDCSQETKWHIYDVFHHMNAVMNASKGYSLSMKLALLLHDITKPAHKTIDEKGNAHFMGHAHSAAILAKQILKRLKFDKATIKEVSTMIEYHDYYMYDTKKSVHKLMYKLNGDFIMAYQILKIQLADNMGKNQVQCTLKNRMIYSVTIMLKEMEKNHECFTIKDLQINGNDLKTIGYSEKEIGQVLHYLLKYVLNQQEKNTKEDLLKAAGGYKNEIINR
ncbi:MAG: CCA tRNA nucleotidyltransferase [Erysipelotrichia bacterium]|nr:CCA tRNA nucleotidyltransferase [Erysipelotrichia bacterium]